MDKSIKQIASNLLKEQKSKWSKTRIPESKRELMFDTQYELECLVNLQYQCDLQMTREKCLKRFSSHHELRKHQTVDHHKHYDADTEYMEECDQCGKIFNNCQLKNAHYRVHLSEEFDSSQVWKCQQDSCCENISESAKALIDHHKVHHALGNSYKFSGK